MLTEYSGYAHNQSGWNASKPVSVRGIHIHIDRSEAIEPASTIHAQLATRSGSAIQVFFSSFSSYFDRSRGVRTDNYRTKHLERLRKVFSITQSIDHHSYSSFPSGRVHSVDRPQ